MSGVKVLSVSEFYAREVTYSNKIICRVEYLASWEEGRGLDTPRPRVYGWAKDAPYLLTVGFPENLIDHLQPDVGFHFSGTVKGSIPFEFLKNV